MHEDDESQTFFESDYTTQNSVTLIVFSENEVNLKWVHNPTVDLQDMTVKVQL